MTCRQCHWHCSTSILCNINFKDDETDENIKNLENKVNIKDYGLLNIKNFILE